jgi:selenocysteine lyase/cysteine desulfurase
VAENGDVNEPGWNKRVEEIRGLVAQLINADPLDVAFVKNTSEGIGIVAEGFPWQPGDNVITAAEEYPANIYPWMNLAARGVELRLLGSRGSRIGLDDLRSAIDARTRIVSLSAVEYASGFRNDLEAVAALCRRHGILLCVDAIQALGALPLDVRGIPVDFLAADGDKWMLGPEGAGILYIRRDLVEQLRPVGVGWNSVVGARDFSRTDFRLKPNAGRWESGSLSVAGVVGLGASLELLLGLGIRTVGERVLELTDYLCEQATRANIEVFSSRQPQDRSGIVSLVALGPDPRAIVRRCRAEGVVINQRGGRLRVSPHCYNTPAELDRLIELIRPGKA